MNKMNTFLLATALVVAGATAASAQLNVDLNLGGPPVYAAPAPVYAAPEPVYVQHYPHYYDPHHRENERQYWAHRHVEEHHDEHRR